MQAVHEHIGGRIDMAMLVARQHTLRFAQVGRKSRLRQALSPPRPTDQFGRNDNCVMHMANATIHRTHKQGGQPILDGYLECDMAERVAWERLNAAPISESWSHPDEPEAALHRIHAYPAKFPAFLTGRALAYAAHQQIPVQMLGDVFCGCGTVAHEARRAGLAFWGCDINPVAILIARAKSSPLKGARLRQLAEQVLSDASAARKPPNRATDVDEFLKRWHAPEQIDALAKLLAAIQARTSERSAYRTALLCAFSSILKACSYWRTWSTKPRLDAGKAPRSPYGAFAMACARMARAYNEARWPAGPTPHLQIADVRTVAVPTQRPNLLVCSAPYSTSVDYAELHQLSAVWLGHLPALARLRRATIGTPLVGANLRQRHAQLNRVGLQAVFALYEKDAAAASAIANYFVDMQQVARRCLDFLAPGGLGVFVIGNARLCGLTIDNAAHFAEALLEAGFPRVRVTRRQVRNKSTSPFRDTLGRLQREASANVHFHEEFILIAHRHDAKK
jgi:SAM-dependent methyltransferase